VIAFLNQECFGQYPIMVCACQGTKQSLVCMHNSMSVSNAQMWPYFGLIGALGGILASQYCYP